MGKRAQLDTVCPNNHNVRLNISREEFEDALKSDSFVLHCNTCDTNWPPSKEIESLFKFDPDSGLALIDLQQTKLTS